MSIYELKRNGKTYQLGTVFRITEDMLTKTTTKTYGVAPYNTSYYYSNYEISADAGIARIEGAWYSFDIDTKTVASAYRNVRVKIGNGEYIPVMSSSGTILGGSSYFTKANSRMYQYSTKYESGGALHLMTDSNTTYSSMSADEGTTGTATSARSLTAANLKTIIEYHAGNLDSALISGASYSENWDGDTHAPTKNAVYDKINAMDSTIGGKVDKITGTATLDRAYIAKADGTQSNYNVSQGASSNAIVRRSGTQIVVPETPTDNTHATSKKYVDDAVAQAGGGNMTSLVEFGRTWWRGTKAMFNALEEKDVNGVYVILSQRDYNKMISS